MAFKAIPSSSYRDAAYKAYPEGTYFSSIRYLGPPARYPDSEPSYRAKRGAVIPVHKKVYKAYPYPTYKDETYKAYPAYKEGTYKAYTDEPYYPRYPYPPEPSYREKRDALTYKAYSYPTYKEGTYKSYPEETYYPRYPYPEPSYREKREALTYKSYPYPTYKGKKKAYSSYKAEETYVGPV